MSERLEVELVRRLEVAHASRGAVAAVEHASPYQWAMYGRRPRCKGKIGHFSEAFGCSHVYGLWMRPLWPLALM